MNEVRKLVLLSELIEKEENDLKKNPMNNREDIKQAGIVNNRLDKMYGLQDSIKDELAKLTYIN